MAAVTAWVNTRLLTGNWRTVKPLEQTFDMDGGNSTQKTTVKRKLPEEVELSPIKFTKIHKKKGKHRHKDSNHESRETNNVSLESPKKSKKNKNHTCKHSEEIQLNEGLSPFECSTATDFISKKKKKKKLRQSEISQENGKTNNVLLESPEKIKIKKRNKHKHSEEIQELSPLENCSVTDYIPKKKKKKKYDKEEKCAVDESSVLDKAPRPHKCVDDTVMKTVSEKHNSISKHRKKKKKHKKKSAGDKNLSVNETEEGDKFNENLMVTEGHGTHVGQYVSKKKIMNHRSEGDQIQHTSTFSGNISLYSSGNEDDDQHEGTTRVNEKIDESEVDVNVNETQTIPDFAEYNNSIRQCLLDNHTIAYTGNVKKTHGNFTYWIQENDIFAQENAKRKKKHGRYNLVDLQTRSVYFHSWDTQCITIPEEISALVHSNTAHRNKEDQESLLERGIRFRTGGFIKAEDNILKENFNNYVSLYPIDQPLKLLFTSHTDNPSYYRKICRETNFYIHLVGNLNRHVMSCYDRARKIIPRTTTGSFSEEETETLKILHTMHGNKWTKIGLEMGRDSQQVSCHWKLISNQTDNSAIVSGVWRKEEEENLVMALKEVTGTNDLSNIDHYNLPWKKIAEKVNTRNVHQCVKHWTIAMRGANRITPMDRSCIRPRWKNSDTKLLVTLIYSLEIEFEDEINWESLLLHFPDVGSPQYLQQRWQRIQRHFCYRREFPFVELKKHIYRTYLYKKNQPKQTEQSKERHQPNC